MSYARFGHDGSDVYVYAGADDLYRCVWCLMKNPPKLEEDWDDFVCEDPRDMLAHLYQHRSRRHNVPQRAIDRLRREGGPHE